MSVVSKALSEKPVVFVGGPSQATALMIKAARQQGCKGGFVVMDQGQVEENEQAGADGDARELGGRDANGASSGAAWRRRQGHLKQVTIAAHVMGGKFVPLKLEQID